MQSSADRVDAIVRAAAGQPVALRDRYVFEASAGDWTTYLAARERCGLASPLGDEDGLRSDENPLGGSNSDRTDVATLGGSRFRLRRVLASSTELVVYSALQVEPVQRPVLLKVLAASGKSGLIRFQLEHQALASLNHPNIARIYEAGMAAHGKPFLAMELVDALTILEHCDRNGVPTLQRARWCTEIARALGHAHQMGVLHGRLHSDSVVVVDAGGIQVPKITGFGIASPTADAEAAATGPGLVADPDAEAGKLCAARDTHADIRSLGVLLHQLLTGRDPEETASPCEPPARPQRQPLVNKRLPSDLVRASPRPPAWWLETRGESPAAIAQQLSGELDAVLLTALGHHGKRRYATAFEMADDLDRCVQGHALSVGHARQLRRLARRSRIAAAALGLAAILLLLGVSSSGLLLRRQRRAIELTRSQSEAILRLSDATRLQACLEAADALVPPYPANIPAMEAWLGGTARELADRAPKHQATLAALSYQLDGVAAEGPELQFQYDLLSGLVFGLKRFTDADPRVGAIAAVESRLALARSIVHDSIERYRDDWDRAIASISDATACPDYAGLRIEPQIGLVPLQHNATTRLWEFWHVPSGARPLLRADGSVDNRVQDGIVMVLIPPGQFWMGARTQDIAGLDLGTLQGELPRHRIRLDPFFMAKFELTQAQWERIAAINPSQFQSGASYPGTFSPLHPVESVTWIEANGALAKLGLQLPTEAQWEYAARAGAATTWWCGATVRLLRGSENLVDRSAMAAGRSPLWRPVDWDDGFPFTAPIGRFASNAYGLYDVAGNVMEWTLDVYAAYHKPVIPGDGRRVTEPSPLRAVRGGSANHNQYKARSSQRSSFQVGDRDLIGIRPARPLDGFAAGPIAKVTKPRPLAPGSPGGSAP